MEASRLACVRGERRLFDQVSFRLDSGGLLYLAGANGAGKTSMIRLLCGLAPPADGEIRWNGQPVDAVLPAFRSELCYLGHNNALQEALTVGENLRFLASLAGDTLAPGAVPKALARLGLKNIESRFVRHLSQGQKRRVALSLLLLAKASLWVLDEPFVALDPAAVALLAQLMGEHLAQGGLAVYTSHQKVDIPAAHSQVVELGS
ncbi:MAG: cytochrome c biogenesis heme-transporting ATPase CcmA [Burkholderiales bacterium]|nr:cytochrome c biogenesis heme-transporting ATPase CcmA [Burkholderiales bacterium]